MFKLIQLTRKKHSPESGFTLIEVLVAALMVFFFVIGSMQALALSVAIRVKAQERQRSNQLIQEDVEQVRLKAENLDVDQSLCAATDYSGGYAEDLYNNLPPPPPDKKLIKDNPNPDSKKYKLYRTPDIANSTSTVLKIDYTVTEVGATPSRDIAKDYIEVIPDAAIECP
jgi:type II secretory pathway pseudopilin PulG